MLNPAKTEESEENVNQSEENEKEMTHIFIYWD